MAKKTSLSVNLLPRAEQGYTERFLHWSLTYGRYIIVGTEIIVLLAFLSRFKLDRDLIDLNDTVNAKKVVLQSLKPTEDSLNQLNQRISQIKTVEGKNSSVAILTSLAPLTPSNITFKDISIVLNKLTIVGSAVQVSDVSAFALQLKSSSLFLPDTATIESLEQVQDKTQASQGIKFTLSANAKPFLGQQTQKEGTK